MPKGYMIAMITVHDGEAYEPYKAQTSALVEEYGGQYLIRGAEQDIKEGVPPHNRMVCIEFESVEKANAFYNDPRYVETRKIRHANSDGFGFIIEGTS